MVPNIEICGIPDISIWKNILSVIYFYTLFSRL